MNSAHRRAAELSIRAVAWRLVGAAAVLIIVLWVLGWLIVNAPALAWVRSWDAEVSARVAADRTPAMDAWSHVASSMSDTIVCILVLVIVMVVFRAWFGRWRESFVVAAAISGELLFFLAVTGVIGRERPHIEHLDAAPPTSSFPSGHVAAAVALYGSIAIVIALNSRRAWIGAVVALVFWTIPVIVAVSRVYRGMHHLSDVIVGAAAGGAWVIVVVTTMYALQARADQPRGDQSRADQPRADQPGDHREMAADNAETRRLP